MWSSDQKLVEWSSSGLLLPKYLKTLINIIYVNTFCLHLKMPRIHLSEKLCCFQEFSLCRLCRYPQCCTCLWLKISKAAVFSALCSKLLYCLTWEQQDYVAYRYPTQLYPSTLISDAAAQFLKHIFCVLVCGLAIFWSVHLNLWWVVRLLGVYKPAKPHRLHHF